MESVRQMIGTIYLALANAAGEGVLEDANTILTDAINSGAVDDIYARSALQTLVRNSKVLELERLHSLSRNDRHWRRCRSKSGEIAPIRRAE